jgi:hypothetical protein
MLCVRYKMRLKKQFLYLRHHVVCKIQDEAEETFFIIETPCCV